MKKIIVILFVAAVLAVLSAGCVAPNTPEQPTEVIDYANALIGEWKSADTYKATSGDVYLIYNFKSDNTGTIGQLVGNSVPKTIDLNWGYIAEDNNYAVKYASKQTVVFFTISADGKTIYDPDGAKFNKIN